MRRKKLILLSIACIILITIGNYFFISSISKKQLYSDISLVPANKVGLLLGTSIFTRQGNPNQYFTNRIKATVELYENNKIEFVIVSGDNRSPSYNEPNFMKEALIDNGIPEEKIYSDYAGFKTLDSVIRAKKVFGQNSITIISQKFHNQRAVFIAKYNEIQAIGFNAQKVPISIGLRIHIREILSRLKATLEVILKKQPKFLGEPIQIN